LKDEKKKKTRRALTIHIMSPFYFDQSVSLLLSFFPHFLSLSILSREQIIYRLDAAAKKNEKHISLSRHYRCSLYFVFLYLIQSLFISFFFFGKVYLLTKNLNKE
jgi:hypothetical protein